MAHIAGFPASLSRHARLAFALFLPLSLAGCPKPQQKFDEFNNRLPVYDLTVPDGPGGMVADVSGSFLLGISTTIGGPDSPLLFIATNTLVTNMDGTATLDLSIKPLSVKDKLPIGNAIDAKGIKVDAGGQFRIDFGMQTVIGAANPISGSDITATLVLIGTIQSKDQMCGKVEGMVSKPIMADLAGSTWGALRIAPGTVGMALPKAELKCSGGATDGGVSDGATDGPARDMSGPVMLDPRISFSAITGKVPLPGDGGVVPTTVTLLSPSPTFLPVGVAHDYDDRNGGLFGCYADFWDVGKNKLPLRDADAGTLTFSGYKGGKLANGMAAPGEINCLIVGSYYKCGYGPIVNNMVGPVAGATPFLPGEMPLVLDDKLRFKGSGGAQVGSFDTMMMGNAGNPVVPKDDLEAIKYNPAADSTINFTCPDMACNLAVAVTILTSEKTPDKIGEDSTRFGTLTCSAAGFVATSIKIPQGAVAAVFGCDKAGKGCAATIQSVRTVLVRFPARIDVTDSKGGPITALIGRGSFAVTKP